MGIRALIANGEKYCQCIQSNLDKTVFITPKNSCDINGIQVGVSLWLPKFLMKKLAAAHLKSCIALLSKTYKRRKKRARPLFWDWWTPGLEPYNKDIVVAKMGTGDLLLYTAVHYGTYDPWRKRTKRSTSPQLWWRWVRREGNIYWRPAWNEWTQYAPILELKEITAVHGYAPPATSLTNFSTNPVCTTLRIVQVSQNTAAGAEMIRWVPKCNQ